MSGFTGKTEQLQRIPQDTVDVRRGFSNFVLPQLGSLVRGGPDIQKYQDLFTMQNERNLAQAKESAGNLTGSGLGNVIGAEAGRAATEQGAFLTNLFEQARRSDADRLASILIPFMNTGVGAPENVYRPGFLDYLGSAGGQVLGAAGAAGGFGKLF